MKKALVPAMLATLLGLVVQGQVVHRLAISHVSLIDSVAGKAEPDMTIVIEGDHITGLGKSITLAIPSGALVVDGKGRFAMPGLWDMHVHLSYARASALPVLVANGVTSVRDMGSRLSEIDEWRGEIAAGRLVGPRIFRAGPILNGREFNRYQLAVTNAAEAAAAVRALQKAGVDFIKVHRATSRDAYFGIAAETKRLAIPFVGHIPMLVTPAEASDAGQATIEHVETLFEGTFLAEMKGKDTGEAIAEWKKSQATVLFAKFATNHTAFTPTLLAFATVETVLQSRQDLRDKYIASSARQEMEEIVVKPLRSMTPEMIAALRGRYAQYPSVANLAQRAGVVLLAGTDLLNPGFNLHDELGLLVQAGLTPGEALRAATANPAELFPQARAGTIAVGQQADLVLLDASPLDNIRNTQRIRAVILGGKLFDRKALDQLLMESERLAARN